MDLPAITDDMMRERLARTREYSIVILRKTARYTQTAEVQAIVWEHGRRNFALRAAGLLSIVCPIRDESSLSGLGIFNADLAQTQQIMDDDPGVQAGIFSFEVHTCRAFPGDCLPQQGPTAWKDGV